MEPADTTPLAFVGMTAAEQAVARLVAKLLTAAPPATAEELYISEKTVESHLGHIFTKLGIRSRQGFISHIGANGHRLPRNTRPDHNQGHT